MRMKKIAAAVALVAASAGANATWVSGQGGSFTNQIDGELIFTAWNAAEEKSITVDLGVGAADFMLAQAGSQTFSLDPADVAFLGSGDIKWNVAGSSTVWGSATDATYGSYGVYFTSNSDIADQTTTLATLNPLFGVFGGYGAELENQAPSAGADNPSYQLEGGRFAGNGAIWGAGLAGITNQYNNANTTASADETLGWWALGAGFQFGQGSAFTDPDFFWELDLASNTLSYNEVPVPAAAWMFGSALLGFAGAMRRRRKNAKSA